MRSVLLQDNCLYDMLLPLDQLFQVDVPPINYLWRLAQFLQEDLVLVFLDGCQKLASVIRIIWSQEIEECWHLKGFNLMDVKGMRLDYWDVIGFIVLEVFRSDVVFWVDELLRTNCFQTMVVNSWYFKMPVDALWNPCHFGVVVPVELLPRRDNHEEKSKLFLSLDRQSYNTRRSLYFCQDFIQLRQLHLVDLSA